MLYQDGCGQGRYCFACAAGAASSFGSLPPTPTSCPLRTVITFNTFCGLLEEVLSSRRGPRAYLAPSPPRKYVPPETYKPQINQRSKQLASKVRPKVSQLCQSFSLALLCHGTLLCCG